MSKIKNKNSIGYCYVAFYIIAVSMLIISFFSDWQIDCLLYNPDSIFAKGFELFAELPMYLVLPFGGTVLFYTRNTKNKQSNIIMGIISSLIVSGGWGVMFFKLGDDWFGEDFSKILRVIIAIALSALSIFLGSLIKQKTMIKLLPFAVVAMLTVGLSVCCGEALKLIWGRARFRDIVNGVDGLTESDFSKWIIPQGNTGNRSFPSGHTYAAADSFILISLADRFKNLKKHEFTFFCIAFIFTILTAFSRLIAGAHFLSDVTMGATISFTIYILIRRFIQPYIFRFFGVKNN